MNHLLKPLKLGSAALKNNLSGIKGVAPGVSIGGAVAENHDLEKLLAWKNKVVGKLTGGLSGMAKARKVEIGRAHV